jgi:ATP-dependent RNA helicase DHX57
MDQKNERMGFVATANLSWKNPKTNELESVKFTPPIPEGYKPTAIEARHQCAVYALHRVWLIMRLADNQIASHKNLQHVLPPEHRTYWQQLESVRKQDMQAGNDYMYQPDPFLSKKQREARLIQLETQRAEAAAKKQADEERGIMVSEGKDKSWDRAPVVEMGLQTRRMVERVIRNRYQWSGKKMSQEPKEEVVEKLSKLGFRKGHVEEACEFTQNEEEALEWLLIYVPEDDLPRRFLPRDYSTGVSILAPTAESLALDFAAERTLFNCA